MLQALLITFREGLESFLIIGVIATYLRRTGRGALIRGVHIGLGISVITCTLGAYLWFLWTQSETGGPNQSKYEGILALVAAVLVGGLLWQTVRAGKHLKGDIEAKVDRAAASGRALFGVAAVTTLLVTRECLEAVLFLGVQAFSAKAAALTIGAVLGLAGAALIAWIWSRFGHRLQIGLVLKVTSIFLAIFLVQLLIYGAHELAESGMIQGSEGFHDATERLGPQGDIGQYITFSLLAAPLLYLVLSRFGRRKAARKSAPPVEHLVGGERSAS